MAHHNITGNYGEELAANYLAKKGYDILHRNWRHSYYEIDIIATFNNVIHFIEVKTRRSATFGYPEDDVSKKKVKFLMSSAEEFLYHHPHWKRIQFDILSLTINDDKSVDYFFIEDVSL